MPAVLFLFVERPLTKFMCGIYKWDKKYQSILFNLLFAELKLLKAILYQEMLGLLYIDGLSQANLKDKLLVVYSN